MAMNPDPTSTSRSEPARRSDGFRRALGTFLGACGAVILATSVLFTLMFPDASAWLTLGPVIVALTCLVFWFAVSYRKLTERLSQRSGVFVVTTVGMSTMLLIVLAGAQYLVATQPWVWDLSAQQVHSLSEQTQKLLGGLTEEIRITGFYEKTQPEFAKLQEWVGAYQRASSRVQFRALSPTVEIEEARRFDVTEDGSRVFIETRWADPAQRRVSRLSLDMQALNHEEALTNGILKALQGERPRIYMVTGHGEVDMRDSGPFGFQQTVADLVGEGYDVAPLNLIDANQVPDDARAILVAGPRQGFLAPEVTVLQEYLRRGGRAAILLEANQAHGLNGLLGEFGIQANDDLVIDVSPFGSMFGGGPDTAIATDYADHPITQKFTGAATVFPQSRSLSVNPGTNAQALSLVRTGDRAWGETQLVEGGALEWNEGEVRGPVTLAIAAERVWDDAPAGARRSDRTRLCVVGDTSFGANQFRGLSANRNLMLNMMGWLTDQEDRIAIRPRSRGSNLILLSPTQKEGIAFFVLYGMPVALLSFGLGLWLVRRQR